MAGVGVHDIGWKRWHRRSVLALIAAAAVLGLLVSSWLITSALRADAEAVSDRAVAMAQAGALLARTEQIENGLLPHLSRHDEPRLLALVAPATRALAALETDRITVLLDRYTKAARAVAVLVGAGRIPEAARLKRDAQGPAAAALIRATARLSEQLDIQATRRQSRAHNIALWIHVATVVLLSGLFWALWFVDGRAERARRRLLELFEARFRGLVARGTDAILLVDATGAVLFASDSCIAVLGVPADAVEGGLLLALFPEDAAARVGEALSDVIAEPEHVAVLSVAVGQTDVQFLEVTLASRVTDDAIGAVVVNIRDVTRRRLTEAALTRSMMLVEDLLDHAPVPIYVKDLHGRYLRVNRAWEELVGRAQADVIGRSSADVFAQDTAELIMVNDRAVLDSGPYEGEEVITVRGQRRVMLTSRFPLIDASGHPYAIAGVSLEITDRLRLAAAERSLGAVVSHSKDAIFTVIAGQIDSWNAAAEALLGYRPSEIIGGWPRVLVPEGFEDEGERLREKVDSGETIYSHQTVCRRKDGSLVHVEATISPLVDGERVVGGSVILRDLTDLRRHQDEVVRLTRTDHLTQLPNRSRLLDVLTQVLNWSSIDGTGAALIYLDVDNFKLVNHSFGHDAGDQVLSLSAARLRQVVRPGDVVARAAGDEFAVVCHPVRDVDHALEISQHLRESLSAPVSLAGEELKVSVSAGLALTPARDAMSWLQEADMAMYEAKRDGRGRVRVVDETLRNALREQISLRNDLGRAVTAGQIVAHYQPVVSLDVSTVVGFEALARWQHPTHGLLVPGKFIAIAEDTGMINEIGLEMLRVASRHLLELHRQTGSDMLQMSFNVSVAQLADPNFAAAVAEVLQTTGIEPRRMVAEITESAFADQETILPTLAKLADAGLEIAIDDFGTGYSSLAYLASFPASSVKIDRVFIAPLGTSARARRLVADIIALARDVDLTVTAEGIETEEQARILKELGCQRGQGFLWGPPVPAAGEQWLLSSPVDERTGDVSQHAGTPAEGAAARVLAAQLYASGTALSTIAAVLNQQRPREPDQPWTAQEVEQLLDG